MPHNKVVFDWFDDNLDFFRPMSSMLYVGWRKRSSLWWLEDFGPKCGVEKFGLVEIFPTNLRDFGDENKEGVLTYNNDIADYEKFGREDEWHTVFWDHGPEHALSKEWLVEVTNMLKKNFKCIIYVCPWGSCPQDSSYGNAREEHAVTIYEKDFEDLGFQFIKTFNKVDTRASGEIVGVWKRGE